MTDNEIVNALKRCRTKMLFCNYYRRCSTRALDDALNLIERQKTEIEQLKEEAKKWQSAFYEARKEAVITKQVSGYIIDACRKEIIGGKQ